MNWRIVMTNKPPDDSGRFGAADIVAINTFIGSGLPDALRYAASLVSPEVQFVWVMPT